MHDREPNNCVTDGAGEWSAETGVNISVLSVHTAIQGAHTHAHSELLYWDLEVETLS